MEDELMRRVIAGVLVVLLVTTCAQASDEKEAATANKLMSVVVAVSTLCHIDASTMYKALSIYRDDQTILGSKSEDKLKSIQDEFVSSTIATNGDLESLCAAWKLLFVDYMQ
jgi:hypothetical protein